MVDGHDPVRVSRRDESRSSRDDPGCDRATVGQRRGFSGPDRILEALLVGADDDVNDLRVLKDVDDLLVGLSLLFGGFTETSKRQCFNR